MKKFFLIVAVCTAGLKLKSNSKSAGIEAVLIAFICTLWFAKNSHSLSIDNQVRLIVAQYLYNLIQVEVLLTTYMVGNHVI